MSSSDHLWPCPPKTKAKLEILRNYLGAWFGILASNGFKHVYYIDGFCGPGQYLGREHGSPVIAASLANSTAQKFSGFQTSLIFVDSEPKALKHLLSMSPIKNHHPNVDIDVKEGIFADEIDGIVAELTTHPQSPTFSFIDPFGFSHSPLDKLKLLMHNQRSEIFVNFSCGFMNRFKEHEDEKITENIKNMVGEDDLSRIIDAADSIDAFCVTFERNLQRIGPFTLKFMMRDEKNIRDNAFFFCGRNAKGFEKIKQAMWKVDPVQGNSFSAHKQLATDQIQNDLFEIGPQTQVLSRMLLDQYAGKKGVSVEELFKWVIEETDSFLPNHARAELEILCQKGAITAITDPSGSTRKRAKDTWPKRLLLDFAK